MTENNIRPVVLITGASGGIGRAIAVKFAEAGYRMALVYHGNQEAAEETKSLCLKNMTSSENNEAGSGDIRIYKADVSEEDDVKELVKNVLADFTQIDVLVNDAGITRDNLTMLMKADEFDSVIRTNLRSTFLVSRAVLKPMMKKRYGRIINISSVVGVHGNAGQVNYSASKAGVIGLTKSLAKEMASRNVTVNAVAPGMIETRMTEVLPEKVKEETISSIPLKRAGKPEEVASAVLFLASEGAGYITGAVIPVDGGLGA